MVRWSTPSAPPARVAICGITLPAAPANALVTNTLRDMCSAPITAPGEDVAPILLSSGVAAARAVRRAITLRPTPVAEAAQLCKRRRVPRAGLTQHGNAAIAVEATQPAVPLEVGHLEIV